MFEIKDVGKLLDEVVGCLLLTDDDEVIDVAESSEMLAYTHRSLFSCSRCSLANVDPRCCCQSCGAVRRP